MGAEVTLFSSIVRRLCVPATPNELAASLDAPVRTIRGSLYQLRKKGLVERLSRSVKNQPGKGRREYFWMAT